MLVYQRVHHENRQSHAMNSEHDWDPGGFKTYPQNMLKRHLNQSNQSSLL